MPALARAFAREKGNRTCPAASALRGNARICEGCAAGIMGGGRYGVFQVKVFQKLRTRLAYENAMRLILRSVRLVREVKTRLAAQNIHAARHVNAGMV